MLPDTLEANLKSPRKTGCQETIEVLKCLSMPNTYKHSHIKKLCVNET